MIKSIRCRVRPVTEKTGRFFYQQVKIVEKEVLMKIRLSDHFSYRRLMRFVLPSIIMMIVTSVYSIVDGFFVSNFVGKSAFAAVNLIMPFLMALGAFGFMIGTGGSALVAKTLGEGKTKQASAYFSMLIYTIMIAGIVLSAVGFVFLRPIAAALGAHEAILEDCVLYGRILLVANTAFMLQNAFQSFLVTAESPKFGLSISILMGLLNILLDFLLVYVFRLGLAGAAVATAISQTLGAVVPLVYFLTKKNAVLYLMKTRFDKSALVKSCINGSSEMLTNISASFVSMLYNFQLMKLAGENGVAAYGVIMYVNFIFMAFYFGFAVGSSPVISYHYGAGNHAELRGLFKKSLVIVSIAAVTMTVLAEVLAHPLSGLFVGYDAELFSMTFTAFRLYSISFLIAGFNIFGSAFFTALNNGVLSAVISFLRTLVIQVAAILILPALLGINGIWIALTVAETLTLTVTAAFLVKKRKQYHYA